MPAGRLICDKCNGILKTVREPRCKKCSKPLADEETEYCFDCSNRKFYYEKGYSLWIYDSTMKKSISLFKYGRRKEYADYYAEELVKKFQVEINNMKPDILIPVPIHSSKLRQRGFNQAKLVAEKISSRLNIPIKDDILLRCGKTLPQKELNNEERIRNLKNAFMINKSKAYMCEQYKTVLLFDDIYTTGSTINSCAGILKAAGINKVFFLTICIGIGF